jgi:hypothetical protein
MSWFAVAGSALTLPSMKIVPLTVSTFEVASQVSSPPAVLHEYEDDGVRLKVPATLLLRLVASGLMP